MLFSIPLTPAKSAKISLLLDVQEGFVIFETYIFHLNYRMKYEEDPRVWAEWTVVDFFSMLSILGGNVSTQILKTPFKYTVNNFYSQIWGCIITSELWPWHIEISKYKSSWNFFKKKFLSIRSITKSRKGRLHIHLLELGEISVTLRAQFPS